jgi:hypothetical protein
MVWYSKARHAYKIHSKLLKPSPRFPVFPFDLHDRPGGLPRTSGTEVGLLVMPLTSNASRGDSMELQQDIRTSMHATCPPTPLHVAETKSDT